MGLRRGYRRHGGRGHSLYWLWTSMMKRCYSPTGKGFSYYGGRGITVDPTWHDFSVFAQDMGERPSGTTLDRIDVNGPYAPWNCRWASKKEQQHNRRDNRLLTIYGETKLLSEWAQLVGKSPSTIKARIARGMTPLAALLFLPYAEGRGRAVWKHKQHGAGLGSSTP